MKAIFIILNFFFYSAVYSQTTNQRDNESIVKCIPVSKYTKAEYRKENVGKSVLVRNCKNEISDEDIDDPENQREPSYTFSSKAKLLDIVAGEIKGMIPENATGGIGINLYFKPFLKNSKGTVQEVTFLLKEDDIKKFLSLETISKLELLIKDKIFFAPSDEESKLYRGNFLSYYYPLSFKTIRNFSNNSDSKESKEAPVKLLHESKSSGCSEEYKNISDSEKLNGAKVIEIKANSKSSFPNNADKYNAILKTSKKSDSKDIAVKPRE